MLAALAPKLLPFDRADPAEAEALLDRAFGADRRGRTAYRVRAGLSPDARLSFAAFAGDLLVGLVQCWPVRLAGPDPAELVLVGPVAVDPARQRDGIGRALMAATLAAADRHGETALAMVGDPGYYGRFGFSSDPTAGWTLPGPFEPHRLLARTTGGRRLPARGMLGPRD